MQRIVEPRVDLVIETTPKALQLAEGDVQTLKIRVINRGNVLVSVRLEVGANTAAEAISLAVELGPAEHRDCLYPVEAVYRRRGDGTIQMTQRVNVNLSDYDLYGTEKT